MQSEQIAYEVKGTTAIVTLNRPERRNALSGKLLRELNAALREAGIEIPVPQRIVHLEQNDATKPSLGQHRADATDDLPSGGS